MIKKKNQLLNLKNSKCLNCEKLTSDRIKMGLIESFKKISFSLFFSKCFIQSDSVKMTTFINNFNNLAK